MRLLFHIVIYSLFLHSNRYFRIGYDILFVNADDDGTIETSTSQHNRIVNLVVTTAPLLSGTLRECAEIDDDFYLSTQLNNIGAEDNSNNKRKCSTGGVAAVQAYIRYYNKYNNATESQRIVEDSQQQQQQIEQQEQAQSELSQEQPVLVIPMGDFKSPLTMMSRFFYGVNVMIFGNELNWRTWTVPAYVLWEHRLDHKMLYDAKEPKFNAVVSNVITSPIESWHPYIKSIHFDEQTHLATIYITKEYLINTHSQIESAQQLLHYIYKLNAANRCPILTTTMSQSHEHAQEEEIQIPSYSAFQDVPFSTFWRENGNVILRKEAQKSNDTILAHRIEGNSIPPQPVDVENCYTPIIIFDDKDRAQFHAFIDAFNQTTEPRTKLIPSLIVDIWGHALIQQQEEQQHWITQLQPNSYPMDDSIIKTWLVSYQADMNYYDQIRLVTKNHLQINNITFLHNDLNNLPKEVQTKEFFQDLSNINQYAREAYETSLVKEKGIKTKFMPAPTKEIVMDNNNGNNNDVKEFRPCQVGECEMGNLYADALRYTGQSDVAFAPSFLFNGPGWGRKKFLSTTPNSTANSTVGTATDNDTISEIRELEILENIPYSGYRCGGTMTGLSLLRLFNYSISVTSFDGYDQNAKTGGRLLQFSGIKVVYDLNDDGHSYDDQASLTPIISIEVYDRLTGTYEPLKRTKLYTFSSCNHLCFTFQDYPTFFSEEKLIADGEIPATAHTELDFKDEVIQYLIAEYFDKHRTYVPQIEGRLLSIDDIMETNITYGMGSKSSNKLRLTDFDDCINGVTYWDSVSLTCIQCPSYKNVEFSKLQTKLIGQSPSKELLRDEFTLTNNVYFAIQIIPETLLLPSNIKLTINAPREVMIGSGDNRTITSSTSAYTLPSVNSTTTKTTNALSFILEPKESMTIGITFDPSERIAGKDTSSVVFEIRQFIESSYLLNCSSYKMRYGITAELSLSTNRNLLGKVALFGYISSAIIGFTSIFFAYWVFYNRKARVVCSMQPLFLMEITVGVFLLGTSLIPYSIDDGIVSVYSCNIACIARPWLTSIGFSLCVSALNAKLHRINKLLNTNTSFRKIEVHIKDVILPSIILITLNFVFMLIWSLTNPLSWKRVEVEGQPWNTYGRCAFTGGDGYIDDDNKVNIGKVMMVCVISLCAIGLIATCWEAFKARNISSEFSESMYLGIAIFSWVQLFLVGTPVMLLVDTDNVVARYSLVVGLLLAICMSMLLVIFVPILKIKSQNYNHSSLNRVSFGNSFHIPNGNKYMNGSFNGRGPSPHNSNSFTFPQNPSTPFANPFNNNGFMFGAASLPNGAFDSCEISDLSLKAQQQQTAETHNSSDGRLNFSSDDIDNDAVSNLSDKRKLELKEAQTEDEPPRKRSSGRNWDCFDPSQLESDERPKKKRISQRGWMQDAAIEEMSDFEEVCEEHPISKGCDDDLHAASHPSSSGIIDAC